MAKNQNDQTEAVEPSADVKEAPFTIDPPEPEKVEVQDPAEKYEGIPVAVFTGRRVVTRRITEKDFAGLGIRHPEVVFERANHHTVNIEGMPEDVVEVLRKQKNINVKGR